MADFNPSFRIQGQVYHLVGSITPTTGGLDRAVNEYTPFISKGVIHAPGSVNLTPITILQDTGANQSILLESRFPKHSGPEGGHFFSCYP